MLAVACPAVVSVNVCSKKGVQRGLLLLPLELRFLWEGLGWLELGHCEVVQLTAYDGVFAFGQISRQDGGFDAWHVSRLAGRFDGGCMEGRTYGLA